MQSTEFNNDDFFLACFESWIGPFKYLQADRIRGGGFLERLFGMIVDNMQVYGV
jgi:hypothetical protein